MTKEQKEKGLKERLRAEYQTCIRTLKEKLPPDLMDQAAEIAAATLVYQQLHENRWSREFSDYLLRFRDPLEMIRDLYPQEQKGTFAEEFGQLPGKEKSQEVVMC